MTTETMQDDKLKDAIRVMREAECLYDISVIEAELDRLADEINARFHESNPVTLCVMSGGLVLAGHLLPRLVLALEFDYLHATRYDGKTTGKSLHWKRHHEIPLKGRSVLVLDDILDEGKTLQSVLDVCRAEGASEVISVVLIEKQHARKIEVSADYVGLQVPDRYVFGFGMDYRGYWRNAAGIFAVSQEA